MQNVLRLQGVEGKKNVTLICYCCMYSSVLQGKVVMASGTNTKINEGQKKNSLKPENHNLGLL